MLTYANMKKHMTRLWCKIMPKTNVEHTEGNEWSYFYLYPLLWTLKTMRTKVKRNV